MIESFSLLKEKILELALGEEGEDSEYQHWWLFQFFL